MNRAELITKMSKKSGLTKKDSEAALVAFMDSVIEALADGEKVGLVGFGSFEVSERIARDGRNPQTGETIRLEASKAPKFRASKVFKDILNA